MATGKTKSELKKVFSGLNNIYLYDGAITLGASTDLSSPKFDLPVTVDSFSFSQAAPTVNGVKVHGLNANWCATSTAGEISMSMTVPSISEDLNKYFLGTTTPTSVNIAAGKGIGSTTETWSGKAYELTDHKITCSFAMIDESGDNMVLVSGIALYATPNFENASTTPFSWTLTGTIEASDTSSDNIAFLTRGAK